jgi:hypothetical protein
MEIPAIIDEEMRSYFKQNYKDGQSLENVLIELKERGYSQMQSVFLLIEQLKLSFVEANRIVLNSKAWNS